MMNLDKCLEEERIASDKQERKSLLECQYCGADIYEGDSYHELDNEIFCCNCFDEIVVSDTLRIAGED